jgi:hypothetical protein
MVGDRPVHIWASMLREALPRRPGGDEPRELLSCRRRKNIAAVPVVRLSCWLDAKERATLISSALVEWSGATGFIASAVGADARVAVAASVDAARANLTPAIPSFQLTRVPTSVIFQSSFFWVSKLRAHSATGPSLAIQQGPDPHAQVHGKQAPQGPRTRSDATHTQPLS